MSEEFNLSKIRENHLKVCIKLFCKADITGSKRRDWEAAFKDIEYQDKEFIKRLKKEMHLTIENADIINKLAGKGLTQSEDKE